MNVNATDAKGVKKMEQEKDHWVRNYKKVSVKMRDGSTLKGKINIKEFPRLSFLFRTSPDNFITLVPEEDPNKALIINKNYVLWAESED